MLNKLTRGLWALLLAGLVGSAAWAQAQEAQEQAASAERGRAIFAAECARCHIPIEMDGRLRARWLGRSGGELFQQIRATMPAETPGSLRQQQYYDLTAFILQSANMDLNANAASEEDEDDNDRRRRRRSRSDDDDSGPIDPNQFPIASLNSLIITPLEAAEDEADQGESVPWAHYNGDERANRYTPLEQINASNVAQLEIAWQLDTAPFGPRPETYSVSTPLMVGGVLYAAVGATRNVVAVDATNGQLLWLWRPQEGQRFIDAPRKGSGKGLAYYEHNGQEVIFTMTPGYYLVALNALTGTPVETFAAGGFIDLKQGLRLGPGREDLDIGISFPPLVAGDVVVAGAAHLVGMRPISASNVKGDIRGFDARSGELLWTFKTIPERGEVGYETWQGDSAEYTGNAGVWAPMSADVERGHVYLPVESATGDRYGADRLGNNLFSSSTVAVDLHSGELQWYFQTTHHDIWDWDTPSAPLVITLPDGRDAVVQTLKQSHLFMFDADSGEPLFPVEERPVPASDTPGEVAALTQPYPLAPPPYDRQGFQEDDLVDFTPEILARAKEAAADYRFSELYTPPSLYEHPADGSLGTLHMPSSTGGSNWEGSAYDPETGIIYISSRTVPNVMALVNEPDASSVRYIQGSGAAPTVDGIPLVKPPYGRITAIDLEAGELLWQITNGDTPEDIKNHPLLQGVDIPPTGKPNRAGMVLTRSLLFFGEGPRGEPLLHAVDKTTGDTVARIPLPAPLTGVPISYMHAGKQYIVVTVSDFENPARIVALALP